MICIETSVPATQPPARLVPDRKKRKVEHYERRVSNLSAKRAVGGGGTMVGMSRPLILTSGARGRVWACFSLRSLRCLLLLLNRILLLLLLPFRRRTVAVSAEEKLMVSLAGRRSGEEKGESVLVKVPFVTVPRRARDTTAAARRAISIRMIGVSEEGDDGRSVRDFSLFSTARGDTLFTQSWTSVSVRTKGLLILLHGLNEHSGRYNQFARKLNESGLKVYAMDWIGGFSSVFSGYERA